MHSSGKAVSGVRSPNGFVHRLRAGDDSVLEEIQRELGPPLHARLSWKYAGLLAPDRIEHVQNVALERLWKYRHQFDDTKGTLRGWLRRITENTARDLLRSRWFKELRQETSIEDLTALDWVAAPSGGSRNEDGENTPEATNHNESLRALRVALGMLSERRRQIVLEAGLTTAELAQQLEISPVTVRRHRQEGIATLRRLLDSERAETQRPFSAKKCTEQTSGQ